MTTIRFNGYGDIPAEIAFRIIDQLRANGIDAEYGASEVSCSAYVTAGHAKLRISDHADRYGSDHTLRVNRLYRSIYSVWTFADEDDEGTMRYVTEAELDSLDYAERETVSLSHVEMDTAAFDALVREGVEFLTSASREIAE